MGDQDQNVPSPDYKNLKSGLINEGAVSQNLFPRDAVSESLNFHFDAIGSATLRKGLTLLGNALSGSIQGLYEFRDPLDVNNQLITVNNGVVYYLSAGSWQSKRTGLNTTNKAHFTTFLSYIFMVNGVDATAVWDGNPANNFITSGNALNAPIGKYIETFRSRVWITGNTTYPDRLYYTSLPSSVTTPIVTWNTDVATGNWIDVSPQDGEVITGLQRTATSLLVFKQNHIYRIYSVNSSESDPKVSVGTYSQESIVETKEGIYFHHSSGFYRYNIAWGIAEDLSQAIIDIVKNISTTNYSKICGWQDGFHVYWSVGDVIISGITYSNLVVRYTISTKVWTHYSYPTQFLMKSNYNDGSTLFQVVGDTGGNILKVNVGTTDKGTPINYSLVHSWYMGDDSVGTIKNITKVLFSHTGGAGSNLNVQNEYSPTNDWTMLVGQLQNENSGFNTNIKGIKCRFRISGVSSGEPFEYRGYEVREIRAEPIHYI